MGAGAPEHRQTALPRRRDHPCARRAARSAHPCDGTRSIALALAGRVPAATRARQRLRTGGDGLVDGATGDLLGSDKRSLRITTTALACLAWTGAGDLERARSAIRALRGQVQDGRFGNTQATALTLRAILAYETAAPERRLPGTLTIRIDAQEPQIVPITMDSGTTPALIVACGVGAHTVSLSYGDGRPLPWTCEVQAQVTTPASDPRCQVRLDTSLSAARVRAGEALECRVRLGNPGTQVVPSPIAIVPLPAGVEPDHEHLRSLVGAKRIAAYEVLGTSLVLYANDLPGGSASEMAILLKATLAGSFTAPAARAYAYYADEHKWWCAPLNLEITTF